MSYVAVRWLSAGTTALAAVMLLASCAVGPDFVHPAAPEITRYTREPLAPQTSGADVAAGQRQRFIAGRDIPKEWWAVFKSPALNALIERSLANNPNLQSTLATLRAAQQAVYAQEGKYFPLVQANFNPLRAQTAATLSPATASGANIYNLYTAQLQVSYTFDVWGLNRRAVESLQALADVQRFEVEAAYLALTSNVVGRGDHRGLAARPDRGHQSVDRDQRQNARHLPTPAGQGLGNASDVAVQAAALAQAKATLPPLRKALAQQRDLLAALSGAYPSEGPRETFRLANLHLPVDLPVSLPSQMVEQRPDVRAAEEQLHSASAQVGVATANLLPNFTISANGGYSNTVFAALISPQSLAWELAGNATQTIFDAGTLLHQLEGARDTYQAAAWTYRGTVIGAVQNVADALRALQNDADALRAARDFERAAKKSLDLAQQQLDKGQSNVLLQLTAEQTYLQANIQVVQAQAARLADTAALFQALGGGWWNRIEPPVSKVLDVGTGQAEPIQQDAPPQ